MKIIYFAFTFFLFVSCSEEPKKTESTTSVETEAKDLPTDSDANNTPEEVKKDLPENQPITDMAKETKVPSKEVKKETKVKTFEEPTPKQPVIEDLFPKQEEPKMNKPDFSGAYNQIVSNFVSSDGKVNYAGIKTNRELLSQATQYFEENPPQSSWSKNEKLAYWINAYNLYTIELVVDNYPIKSIKDLSGGKPWDKKFIKLDGRTLSLNDIENGIIRKDFDEPRIHFAVNCASISCPKLLNKAYTESNLNSLLDSQTKRFINDNSMNSIGKSNIEISNIFDWYKSDFGNVISFLNKYSNTTIDSGAKVSYKEYNWNLNK